MKINKLFYFHAILFLGFVFNSCSNKNEKKNLVNSHIKLVEDLHSDLNSSITICKNYNTKIQFYKMDPAMKKYAYELEPIQLFINHEVNKFEDFLVKKMNELIVLEMNDSNWFYSDKNSKTSFFRPLSKLKNLDNCFAVKKMYGDNTKQATQNSTRIKDRFENLRDNIILLIVDTIFTAKNEITVLTKNDLKDYNNFKTILEQTNYPYRMELLQIHEILSFPELYVEEGYSVKWNQYLFNNRPLIGAISVFVKWRLSIRNAERISNELLFKKLVDGQYQDLIKRISPGIKVFQF